MKNWQTTVAGIGSILTGLGNLLTAVYDGDPNTEPNYALIAAAIVVGIGLIRAKDASSPN